MKNISATWGYAPGANSQHFSPLAECEKQDFVADGEPIYDIVEQFAEDHSVWAEAFLKAWQAMQELRQDQNVMKDGPVNSWLGFYTLQEMGAVTGEFLWLLSPTYPVTFVFYRNNAI